MRLEYFHIGGSSDDPAHRFRNLRDVAIRFDTSHWVTVAIGWNGTGKSNILEALAIVFRELIMEKPPSVPFAFRLIYRIGLNEDSRRVFVNWDPLAGDERITVSVQSLDGDVLQSLNADDLSEPVGKSMSMAAFRRDPRNLPKYVFSYYSGEGTRLQEVFLPYLEKYDSDLRAGKDPGLKRLFYAMPVHSQFVLLAFLIHQDDQVRSFMSAHLGIDPDVGVESVLFVLRQPPWSNTTEEGDSRFWNARGIVQRFLSRLQEVAIAPLATESRVPVSLWNKRNLGFKYLFLNGPAALRNLVQEQSSAEFFRDLESTYVSQLVEEVRIRIRLNDGASVTFRELSEGEQQLLTVLGLLRFTAEEESLFLLDEPDTHLNPRWSVDYLKYLELFLEARGDQRTSHVVMTTHNPIAIAGLEREQVQVVSRHDLQRTTVGHPALAPKGMGYAGVVTSDMFGLGSSLDRETTDDLRRLHRLADRSELSSADRVELSSLRRKLEDLDFNFAARDRLEQEFRRARFDLVSGDLSPDMGSEDSNPIVTPENKAQALTALIASLLAETKESGEDLGL